MKTISTTAAILMAINEFGDNPFSIWDITNSIREHVNDEHYQLRYEFDNVEHETVKDFFLEIADSGLLDDYYTKFNVNGYREFCKVNPVMSQPAVVTKVVPTPTTATVDVRFPPSVQEKMYNYIKNRGPSSMKQIQSRLKGHNYTCQELYDFFNKIGLIDKTATTTNISEQYTVCL
jgi:hypothetical protein